MRAWFPGLGALALLLLLAATSAADERSIPIQLRRIGEPLAAVDGVASVHVFELSGVAEATRIEELSIEGAAWSPRLLDTPSTFTVARGKPVVLRIAVSPRGALGPIVLRGIANGVAFARRIDLSAAATARARAPRALVAVSPRPGLLQPLRLASLPRPAPPATQPALSWQEPGRAANDAAAPRRGGPASAQSTRTIRVHGRIVYTRPDGVIVGADGASIRAFDEDDWPNADDELGASMTDAFGNFDFNVIWDGGCFLCESDPDLYIQVEASSAVVQVRDDTPDLAVYRWVNATTANFTGTDYNAGSMTPGDEADLPALHLLTDVTRNWRWYLEEEGYDQPLVFVNWPSTDDNCPGAWYDRSASQISVCSDRSWREDTHAHEYGHHFIATNSSSTAAGYCNGICDDDVVKQDCGHCRWCDENENSAWNEGWPNWIAHVQTSSYLSRYAIASVNTRDQESLANCGATGSLGTATLAEGFIGAFLQDVWDSTNEDDANASGAWQDKLSWGTNEIFDVVTIDQPKDPLEFIQAFGDRYPLSREAIWETAKNCTFEVDVFPPGGVGNLVSTSHQVEVPSADPTITVAWSIPADDWSGVGHCAALVATDPGDSVVFLADSLTATTWNTPVLRPGRFVVRVVAYDRAGNMGTPVETGVYVIRDPESANLQPLAIYGWPYPMVPRTTADTDYYSATAPVTLPGDTLATYWNQRGKNVGETATSSVSNTRVFLDGLGQFTQGIPVVGAFGEYLGMNLGPYSVRGGRHSVATVADVADQIAESVETDNTYGRQWAWTPHVLAPWGESTRDAPPARTAGWDLVTDGAMFYNSDGLRVHAGGSSRWHAVAIRALDVAEDYDCRIHVATASADSGFGVDAGQSARAAGLTDAVLATTALGDADWDVGVLNATGGSGDYVARHVVGLGITFDSSATVVLGSDRVLELREVQVPFPGPVSYTARITNGKGPVHMAWFGPGFTTGGLLDASGTVVLPDSGTLGRMDVETSAAGSHGIALYRDPVDGLAPVTVVIEVGDTPPDAVPFSLSAWYSALVPRPDTNGSHSAVLPPDTLIGNAAATYLNFGVLDDSPTTLIGLTSEIEVDGAPGWSYAFPPLVGHTATMVNGNVARDVRGGRHTLSVWHDLVGAIEEKNEANNAFGSQWVWSPLPLTIGVPVSRAAPPARTGGWDRVTGEELWYNCDGLRMPAWLPVGDDGWWGAAAVMPGDSSDVDVRLHEPGAGARAGFQDSYGVSAWGAGSSDFSLVNFRNTTPRALDAGILLASGAQAYVAEAARSGFRASDPDGVFGPFTLGANRVLDLHEFWLSAGTWDVDLLPGSGAVDWGLSIHDTTAFQVKSDAIAMSYLDHGVGQGEQLTVATVADGYACIVAWKVGAADLAVPASYALRVRPNTLGLPGNVVNRTAFRGIAPNPARGGALVSFELARHTETSIEVFDLRGARICTLARGGWPSGRHSVEWTGRDEGGAHVAPGVYLLRFRADGVDERRKLVQME